MRQSPSLRCQISVQRASCAILPMAPKSARKSSAYTTHAASPVHGHALLAHLALGLAAVRDAGQELPQLADVIDADVVALVQVEPGERVLARHHVRAQEGDVARRVRLDEAGVQLADPLLVVGHALPPQLGARASELGDDRRQLVGRREDSHRELVDARLGVARERFGRARPASRPARSRRSPRA